MTRAGCLTSLAFLLFNMPMKASVKRAEWGRTSSNRPVKLFTLSDARIRVRLIEYGARIVSIDVPDRRGQTADVVLGHNNLAAYLADPKGYFGAVVGRYGNRIAKGHSRLRAPPSTYRSTTTATLFTVVPGDSAQKSGTVTASAPIR
jgi:hypothetical protein